MIKIQKIKHLKNKITVPKLFLVVLLLGAVLMFAACKQEQSKAPALPAPQVVKQITAIPVQKPVSSSLKLEPAQRNELDFSNKKDPFRPFISINDLKSKNKGQQEDKKAGLPIHSFDVSQFRVIGIVTDSKGNKAMVVDPAGKGYVLRVGMTIGPNEGKIIRIDASGVEVIEQSRDAFNKVRKETVRIPLLKKP